MCPRRALSSPRPSRGSNAPARRRLLLRLPQRERSGALPPGAESPSVAEASRSFGSRVRPLSPGECPFLGNPGSVLSRRRDASVGAGGSPRNTCLPPAFDSSVSLKYRAVLDVPRGSGGTMCFFFSVLATLFVSYSKDLGQVRVFPQL